MTGAGATVLPLIERWSGLDLERGGQGAAICRFVAGRALALGLPSPQAYVERLGEAGGEEEQRLVHAITIGHTWFFRDPQQLEQIAALWRARYPAGQRVSVWVAGCASGEDVYSLALLGEREGRPLSLLGSDINGGALAAAARGRYPAAALGSVPEALRPRFRPLPEEPGVVEIDGALRRAARFELHNLVRPPPPPPPGGWDIILCRNVLIYFQPERVRAVLASLSATLAERGLLLLGAAEVLRDLPPGLRVADLGARYALERRGPAPAAPPAASPEAPPPSPEAPSDAAARARARLREGVARYAAEELGAAIEALREALRLAPALWPASFYLALSYERQGRTVDSLREFRRALEGAEGSGASAEGLPSELQPWRGDMLALCAARLAAAGPPRRPPSPRPTESPWKGDPR